MVEFSANPKTDPLSLVKMVQNQPHLYQLRGANQLLFHHEMPLAEDRITAVNQLLIALSP